jgi:hypothetical protein
MEVGIAMTSFGKTTCASCGKKQPDIIEGEMFRCSFCRSKNIIVIDSDRQLYEIPIDTDNNAALRSVKRFLSEEQSVDSRYYEALESDSEIVLYYVPFYVSEGTATVCFTVRKIQNNTDTILMSGGKILYVRKGKPKTAVTQTRVQFTEFFNCLSAVADLDWGLNDFEVKDIRLVYLDDLRRIHNRGHVLTPTMNRETFDRLQHNTGRRQGDYRRDIITQKDKTVYVPVWRLLTRFNGIVYEAFVNAATGDCLKAGAPESASTRATSFSISFAVMAFLSSGMIVFGQFLYAYLFNQIDTWFEGLELIVLLLIVIMIACVCLLAGLAGHGWDRVKHRYEIVKTPKRVFVHPLDKSADTWLDRLHNITLKMLNDRAGGIAQIEE